MFVVKILRYDPSSYKLNDFIEVKVCNNLKESQKFLKEKRLEKPKLKDMKTSKCTESCSCNQIIQKKILNELKYLNSNFESRNENDKIVQFAAMVIDRFCLFVFTITTLLSFLIFISTSKNL